MDITLMMSAKLATAGFLKINIFWNKGFDVIVSVYDVTNKIWSRDSNCIVDVVMRPKFGNTRKTALLSGGLGSSLII